MLIKCRDETKLGGMAMSFEHMGSRSGMKYAGTARQHGGQRDRSGLVWSGLDRKSLGSQGMAIIVECYQVLRSVRKSLQTQF